MNIIGYFNYSFGYAKNCKYLDQILTSLDIPHTNYNYDLPEVKHTNNLCEMNNDSQEYKDNVDNNHEYIPTNIPCIDINNIDELRNSINIFIVNVEDMMNIFSNVQMTNNINIYYYVCEVNNQEESDFNIYSLFDFIWVPSKFCFNCISSIFKKLRIECDKIRLVPLIPIVNNVNRSIFDKNYHNINNINNINNTDDDNNKMFINSLFKSKKISKILENTKYIKCLYVCDILSGVYRKNILGFIALVTMINSEMSITSNNPYIFILKVMNLNKDKDMKYTLLDLSDKYKNFILIDEMLSDENMGKLYDLIDVYISPHRSEGFGLTIYEAYIRNKIIMCSNSPEYNIEFLNEYDNFINIDYKLTDTNIFENSLYKHYNSKWMEPDINDIREKLLLITPQTIRDKKTADRIMQNMQNIQNTKSFLSIDNIQHNVLNNIYDAYESVYENPRKNFNYKQYSKDRFEKNKFNFDIDYYCSIYPDVDRNIALFHYANHGMHENRKYRFK